MTIEDVETESAPTEPRRPSALDRRVPIALAVLGLLFLGAGLSLVWSASSMVYYETESGFEQFTRAVMNYFPGPAITIGLLSIGAAITVRAARS
ncbi:hypothetical protein [Rathayibacter]|uniref:hypothetical protein n=1 Tax=Rathayibacter TaxID=33886 RepID=UPI000FD9DA1B|nr:hypothetical protein [Rathayibacter]